MAKIRIKGDTSGYIDLEAPAVAGTTTFDLTNLRSTEQLDSDYVKTTGGSITGDLSVDSDTFYVDTTNNRVGIGTDNPQNTLDISKSTGSTPTVRIRNTSNAAQNEGQVLQIGSDRGTGTSGAVPVFEIRGNVDRESSFQLFSVRSDGDIFSVVNNDADVNMQQWGIRAFVNFDGTGTPSIRKSGNISSINDSGHSSGYFQVSFSTAMPDTNYAVNVTGTCGGTNSGYAQLDNQNSPGSGTNLGTTTYFALRTVNGSGGYDDHEWINAMVVS